MKSRPTRTPRHRGIIVLVGLATLVIFTSARPAAAHAQFIAGSYTLLPSSTGQTVSMRLAGVQGERLASATGGATFGFELWYLPEPFYGTGKPDSGFRVASTYLPVGNCTNARLDSGESCLGLTLQPNLSVPPPGSYYPVLFLVERDGPECVGSRGACYDDHVALTNAFNGSSIVTVRAVSGRISVKSTGGGAAGTGVFFTPGTEQVSYNFTADTVDLSISGVENTNSYETGTLEVEVWFSSSPYNGGTSISGTKVASYRLPSSCTIGNNQLAANSGCSTFDSGTIAASFPSPGTYYVILTLDEYDSSNPSCSSNNYFCFDDAVQTATQATVPAPSLLSFGGGGGSGGGGAVGLWTLAGLSLLALMKWASVRLRRRRAHMV